MVQNAKYAEEMSCLVAYWEQIYEEIIDSIPSIPMISRGVLANLGLAKGLGKKFFYRSSL
jgi:hypothetical protein